MTKQNKIQQTNKLNFLLILFFLFNSTSSIAQSYADKEFYLLDSLVIEILDDQDKNIIDSVFSIYHKTENDLKRIELLKHIVDEVYDDVFLTYNRFYLNYALVKAKEEKDPKLLLKYKKHLANGIAGIGYEFDLIPSYDSALFYYSKAEIIYKEINDLEGQAGVLNAKALVYQSIGDVNNNLTTLKEALALSKKVKSHDITSSIYVNMSLIQQQNLEYDACLKSIDQAIYYAKKSNDRGQLAGSIIQKGETLIELGKDNLGLALTKQGINILAEIGDEYGKLIGVLTLIKYHISKEEFENSEKIILSNKKSAEDYSIIDAMISFHYAKVLKAKGQQQFALKEAIRAYELGKEINERIIESNAALLISNIEYDLKNYKTSVEYLKIHDKIKYSLLTNETKRKSMKLEMEFQFEKQKEIDDLKNQQQLDLASEKQQRTRFALIGSAVITGLIALFSIFIFNRLKLIRKQKTELDNAYEQLEESKKNELAVSNLKALQSQMNPHFIFNALNSVQDLVLLKDIRNSNKYLGKFSDLIRKILLSSKEQFITLEEEIEMLTLYLDLEKLRFGDDFVIDLQCNVSQEKQDEIELPAMFIQPYIENAIKHGLFHKEGRKELLVHFNLKGNTIECIIKDNGIGQEKAAEFKQKRLHLHTGFSTEAINERIRLLNETLDKKIELITEDLFEGEVAVGTKIIIKFPI